MGRGITWKQDEDIALCQCYIEVVKEFGTTTEKSYKEFWRRVYDKFTSMAKANTAQLGGAGVGIHMAPGRGLTLGGLGVGVGMGIGMAGTRDLGSDNHNHDQNHLLQSQIQDIMNNHPDVGLALDVGAAVSNGGNEMASDMVSAAAAAAADVAAAAAGLTSAPTANNAEHLQNEVAMALVAGADGGVASLASLNSQENMNNGYALDVKIPSQSQFRDVKGLQIRFGRINKSCTDFLVSWKAAGLAADDVHDLDKKYESVIKVWAQYVEQSERGSRTTKQDRDSGASTISSTRDFPFRHCFEYLRFQPLWVQKTLHKFEKSELIEPADGLMTDQELQSTVQDQTRLAAAATLKDINAAIAGPSVSDPLVSHGVGLGQVGSPNEAAESALRLLQSAVPAALLEDVPSAAAADMVQGRPAKIPRRSPPPASDHDFSVLVPLLKQNIEAQKRSAEALSVIAQSIQELKNAVLATLVGSEQKDIVSQLNRYISRQG